jgi:arabinogalactan endo-1,4-beta-galactosidase
LKDSLKIYTKRVLIALKEQGTLPEMVQIGNEINHGILWPDGHIGNFDNLLFNTNDLVKRYNKDINVVEYSQYKKEVHEIVFGLPGDHGEGTFIWEPLNNFFSRDREVTNELKAYDEISKMYLTGR